MFFLKNKLSTNLKNCIVKNLYKKYKIIIKCKKFQDHIIKKLKGFKADNITSIQSLNLISAIVSPFTINRLLEFPEVEFIDFDIYAHLCGVSVSTANKLSVSYNSKFTGKGIGIGIIDSGIFPHTDLVTPSNKIKYFLDIINNLKYPYDDNGHGTFIAGIISGSGISSNGLYKGIAPKASIYAVKAFNSTGKGFVSDILLSLDHLINISLENNIKIFCLPFEILEYNEFIISLFKSIFQKAVDKNITIIVPSGSNPCIEGLLSGISTLDNCITVGGFNSKDSQTYSFSSCGPINKIIKPDFISACVDICSLNSDTSFKSERNGIKLYPKKLKNPYITYTGTSCSVAYISGLCALLYESNANLSFKDILSLLKISSESKGLPKNIEGNGEINISKLL